MALIVGKFYFRPNATTSEVEGETGRVALAYRRAHDGRWLLLYDMDNSPPDIVPQAFARRV